MFPNLNEMIRVCLFVGTRPCDHNYMNGKQIQKKTKCMFHYNFIFQMIEMGYGLVCNMHGMALIDSSPTIRTSSIYFDHFYHTLVAKRMGAWNEYSIFL